MVTASLICFIVGFVVCITSLLLLLRLTKLNGFNRFGLDKPDGLRKTHDKAVLRLGGAAIFLAFIILAGLTTFVDTLPKMESLPALSLGATLMFALGTWDDFKSLPAKIKLAGQILIAVLMWKLGLRIELLSNPATGEAIQLAPPISFIISVLWLVAIPNVVNLADGMDGLAGGVGVFLFITLGFVGVLNEFQHGLGLLSFGLVGAMVAFLIYNFPPARIFLGDGGAYFIGFFIAAASMGSSQKSYIGASLLITLIALGVPILDTIFAFGRRILKGVPVMRGDSEHIHHRLLLMGMSSGKALFILYGIFIVLSILALSTIFYKSISLWLSIVFLILIAVIALRGLGYIRTFRSLPADLRRMLRARKDVRYAVLISQALELEIDRLEDGERFWEVFERELSRLDFSISTSSKDSNVVFHHPFKGVAHWTIGCRKLTEETTEREAKKLARETVASCFITPFYLGIKKFGAPEWEGLTISK